VVVLRRSGLTHENLLVTVPLLILAGVPVNILLYSLLREYPAHILIRRVGLPSLIIFLGITLYLTAVNSPVFGLILWGAVGGALGTVALDVVRLSGVMMGLFPVDMPRIFGALALNTFFKFVPKNAMANMVDRLSRMPEKERKSLMSPRLHAFARLPDEERQVIVDNMVKAINRLPSDRRDLMMKTMIEIFSELPENERRNMMRSMDTVIFASTGQPQIVHQLTEKPNPRHEVEDARRGPRAIFRRYGIPRWPMKLVYPVMTKALYDSAADADIPFFHVLFAGYLWHYIIGMTFGIAHTLLFGTGTWLTVLGFGVFIWAVMMAVMPSMMPMIKLPYPKFMVIPLIAHLAFAIPLGFILMNLISPQSSASSILSLLLAFK
jgi:hypothetical protein